MTRSLFLFSSSVGEVVHGSWRDIICGVVVCLLSWVSDISTVMSYMQINKQGKFPWQLYWSNKVLKCDVTNTSICEIIVFDEIFRMSTIKNACLSKISILSSWGWDWHYHALMTPYKPFKSSRTVNRVWHRTHINLNSLWPNITSSFFLSFILQYN